MISRTAPTQAFVWTWPPGATEPVVVGRLARDGESFVFNYGRSWLARPDAYSLYEPELPLGRGALPLLNGLSMPGSLRDASPDAWGRRVILNQFLSTMPEASDDPSALDELTYLLWSGSDRIGALDFQASATRHEAREAGQASLEELQSAAERVEMGIPLSAGLDEALLHGSSIGGARPKALIVGEDAKYIAKFSSQGDVTNVVKGEYVAMRLAALTGLDVADVRLERAAGRDVLLIRRFDREKMDSGWSRKSMVSALTLLGLDEMMARYASYEELATIVRHRFDEPAKALRELYGRLVFNILVGNTDDHARNHAALWERGKLRLTPAYDICPQPRAGGEASQAMAIIGQRRDSRIATCLDAVGLFLLSRNEAIAIASEQARVIAANWRKVSIEAMLTPIEERQLWRRAILNPFAFEGAPESLRTLVA